MNGNIIDLQEIKDKKDFSIKNNIDNNIIFNVGGKVILRLSSNGNIYVKEQLAENDKQVVDQFREFITQDRFARNEAKILCKELMDQLRLYNKDDIMIAHAKKILGET